MMRRFTSIQRMSGAWLRSTGHPMFQGCWKEGGGCALLIVFLVACIFWYQGPAFRTRKPETITVRRKDVRETRRPRKSIFVKHYFLVSDTGEEFAVPHRL